MWEEHIGTFKERKKKMARRKCLGRKKGGFYTTIGMSSIK